MAKNPLIRPKEKSYSTPMPNQSAGILDDFAVRRDVATNAGTIEKVPVANNDIVNKSYVDTEAALHVPYVGAIADLSMPDFFITCSLLNAEDVQIHNSFNDSSSLLEIGPTKILNSVISDTTGAISFDDENIKTTGIIDPTLTTGSVLFIDANGITEDNFNLFWDNAINELQPNLLKITSDGTQAAPALKFNDTNTGFFKLGDSVRLSINNSTIMTVNATGLDVTGNETLTGDLTINTDALFVDATQKAAGIGTATLTQSGGFGGPGQKAVLWVYDDEVGKLTSIIVAGKEGSAIQFTDANLTPTCDFGFIGNSLFFVNRHATGPINFRTNNVDRLRIFNTDLRPGTDSSMDFGTTTLRWKDAYIDTLTLTDTLDVGGDTTFNGDVTFTGAGKGLPYADLYVQDNTTPTVITTAGKANKVQLTIFDTNGLSNNATPDHTNDHITIVKAGVYFVSIDITASGVGGDQDKFGFSLYKNNGATEFPNVHSHETMAGGVGDINDLNMSGIVDLAVDDTIEIWLWNEDDTDNILIDDVSLNLMQLGGT